MGSRRWCVAVALALLCGWSVAAWGDMPAALSPQTLKMPSGPASLKGLGESFAAEAGSGAGSYSVSIEVAPGILAPTVQLSYSGGHGRTEVGAGWRLNRFRIYRTTDKGLPRFEEADRFGVEGPGLNDELVLVNPEARYYRLKNEGAFALFGRDVSGDKWTIHLKSGETVVLGETAQGRDANSKGSYRWYAEREDDAFGHRIAYDYTTDRGRKYLKAIRYQLHAAPEARNQISFNYEARPDVFTDYTYGAAETTARRLQAIDVFHGARRLRRYSLGYEEGVRGSQLVSVDEEGEYGLHKPKLTMGYVPFTETGKLVTMASPPPLDGLDNGQATLEDVNGDGLPDVLWGVAGAYRYYENVDGVSWATSPRALARSPEVSLGEQGVMMVDADGDGFRDVLYPHLNSFRYASGGDIKDGVLKGYGAPKELETQGQWHFDWTSPLVKVSDVNFDGRIDLLVQRPGALAQVLNAETGDLVESTLPELPVDVDFSDSRVRMLDFNGDGILDFVREDISYQQGRVRVWYGLGWGQYLPEQQMSGVPTGDAAEVFLEDVNGDGQTDLVVISGAWVVYHLNDGNGHFGPAKGGDYRGVPATYQTKKLLFADMNGNGTTDIVWVMMDGKLVYLELSASPFYGQLTRVDNGMGAVTAITHRSSTDYLVEAKRGGKPWHTPVVRPVPVVSEVRVSDSFDALGLKATESVTKYDYRDGYFDTREREWRGFGEVAVTEVGDEFHEGKVTRTWFSVGRNLVTGEDEEILKGKPYQQVVMGMDGRVLTTTETQWERRWLCQEDLGGSLQLLPRCATVADKQKGKDLLVAFGVQTGALTGAWEGTKQPRFTYGTSEVDGWGNATGSVSYGEVAFVGGHAVGQAFALAKMNTGVGHDEVQKKSHFINRAQPSNWLIGVGYQSDVLNVVGDVVASSRTYFDGVAFEGMPLGQAEQGRVMREDVWLKYQSREQGVVEDRWVSTKRNKYNADGLVEETRDALGSQRKLEYDSVTRAFVSKETVLTESGALDVTASYDTGLGVVVSAQDFNGNTSRFTYDGLARLTGVFGALDSTDRPVQRFSYAYGTQQYPVSSTLIEALVDRSTGRYTRTWSYSDGLGRERLAKTEAEAPHGYVASGWQVLSPQGKPTRVSQAFATNRVEFEGAPDGTPATVTYLDAAGRPLKAYAPPVGGQSTYTANVYLPFETQIFDERDTSEGIWKYPAISRVDGQGRVVEEVRHNDYDGQFAQLKWTFAYDAVGNVTAVVDPKANQRKYTYDSLSRMRRVVDANAGTQELTYDDGGNLTQRLNAEKQRVTAEYGLHGRIRATRVWRPGASTPERSYEYGYDTPGPGMPEAKNLRGQVAWASDAVSRTSWSYDEHGKPLAVAREIWDPIRSPFEAQKRDVYRMDLELDPQKKLLSARLPGGFRVGYRYNERSLVESLSAGFGGEQRSLVPSLKYDAPGGRVRADYGNGTTSCTWYDGRHRAVARKVAATTVTSCAWPGPDSSALQHLTYSYTPNGLVESITDGSPVRVGASRLDASYGYDRLYQLTSAKTTEGTLSYRYDVIQNLVSQQATQSGTGLPLGSFSYGENGAGPNAVTGAGRERFVYDAAGRMRAFHTFELRWDGQDRLLEAKRADGTTIQNFYDHAGERVLEVVNRPGAAAEVHRYVFDGYHVHGAEQTWVVSASTEKVAEIRETSGLVPSLGQLDELVAFSLDSTRRPKPAAAELLDVYPDGHAVDAQDLELAARRYLGEVPRGPAVRVWQYYHEDHLGAPTHISDSAGDWMSSTRFHPYGQPYERRGDRPAYGYAGSLREAAEELGLVRMGARWYAPELGRWITPDPLYLGKPKAGMQKPFGLSLYTYASNSPLTFLDPGGLDDGPSTKSRIFGALRAVGGALEIATAASATAATGGAGLVVTGLLFVHGIDQVQAGLRQLVTGQEVDTVVSTGLQKAGMSREGANLTDAAIGMTLTLGASALKEAAKAGATSGAKCLGGPCPCFVAGTAIDTPHGAMPIEAVALGERVGPESAECAELRVDDWVAVGLRMVVDGPGGADVLDLQVLRPREWFGDQEVAVGNRLTVRLEELNVEGAAVVTEVGPPPRLEPGSRCPVTGRVRHVSHDVITVSVEGGGKLEVTKHHPLLSADRGDWVAAKDLRAGERLRTRGGVSWVLGVTDAPRLPVEVFNLEVHKEHRYFVGKVGVVAHNACVDPTRPAGEVLPGSLRRVFPGEHLGKSLNEIKDALRTAKGSEVKPLQTAKKLLEQAERLLDKAKNK